MEMALQDADASLENDSSFYRGYYYKAEAFYAGGRFEDALYFYYKAYYFRPDIEIFRLGIQKAEEAVLRAMDKAILFDHTDFQPNANPEIEEMQQILQNPVYPEYELPETRCLCGCRYCNVDCCRDIDCNDKFCSCRCEACVHHLAYAHGEIADPATGNLISLSEAIPGAVTENTTPGRYTPGMFNVTPGRAPDTASSKKDRVEKETISEMVAKQKKENTK